MSMASLKSVLTTHITATVQTEELKAQCHLMEVTFLVLLHFEPITNDAAECITPDVAKFACELACYLCKEYFTDAFQVTSFST